jgi:NitT/TauT family transport system ATP-binding protein
MRHRATIARALANQPPIMPMDEPFGALDAQTGDALQSELLTIWQTTPHDDRIRDPREINEA